VCLVYLIYFIEETLHFWAFLLPIMLFISIMSIKKMTATYLHCGQFYWNIV